ncbi:MAG TPA: serine--tRNA ligase [Candidatus Nanoarchaeia archaeon]|nr:serine--tRNA ligase [Candidatus Nanoarchaeia archaeon]
MIDIRDLREHPEVYKDSARKRGITVDIDEVLKLDTKRVKLLGEVESLRAKLNVKGKPTGSELKQLQQAKDGLGKLESELTELDSKLQDGLFNIPNLVADDTPQGGEDDKREEKKWGEPKKEGKDHLTVAEANDWIDFERGAKVAGNKFYYLKGPVVRLELAVMQLVSRQLEMEGFTLMATPHLVNNRIFEGTGFQPRGEEEQAYSIEGEDLKLIGTAEIALTGYYADEIIDPSKLPLAYAALTPSYRKEAGAYGKHSKGLYRVHQFDKLEMYIFCDPAESEKWHQRLLEIEEKICQTLEIPYRVVRIAAGDLGAPAYKKYDIEYWSPADGEYRELTSCSNCTDFQARRLNIRTRDKDGKTQFVHTLNGTAVAYSRVLIAMLENHQTKDGKIQIPTALQQYYGGSEL